MSNDIVNSELLDNRAHWKKIARMDKVSGSPSLADLGLSGGSTTDTFYLLFENQPYCFFEGAIYQMLPVEDPSIGYKLVDSTYDKKTLLSRAISITEVQAIDAMFLVS